jgi:hypothetical protein
MFLRQHYLTPLATTRLNLPSSAWIVGQWWTKDGKFAYSPWPPNNLAFHLCPPSVVGQGKSSSQYNALVQCFNRHGYAFWHHYQPASRFWTFQTIETGWLLALSPRSSSQPPSGSSSAARPEQSVCPTRRGTRS